MNDITGSELCARYLSGECTEEEKAIIEEWVNSSRENRKLMKLMKNTWNSRNAQSHEWDINSLWAKIVKATGIRQENRSQTRVLPLRSRLFGTRLLKVAAVLILMASLPYFYVKIMSPPSFEKRQDLTKVLVDNGEKEIISLPDGTIITLDSGSSFSYPEQFNGNTREVMMSGEGYFEVAHNPDRPFIAYANDAVIEVLGTEFNVRAWEEEKIIKVAVKNGKVSLRSKRDASKKKVIIIKGQMSTIINTGSPSDPRTVDVDRHLAWQNRETDFENTTLKHILQQLERWYNLKISLEDVSLASERLTMHIENRPVDDILGLIATLMDVKYERIGNMVVFRAK